MSSRWPKGEQLEQVHELNRLFLGYLQDNLRDGQDALDLPEGARAPLEAASLVSLDAVAEFPRALFRFSFDERAAARFHEPLRSRAESMRHSVNLTILLCAWTFSRHSVYEARLLLGLESRMIARLRSLQITDLQRLSFAPRLVLCAFAAREWLWIELLTQTRPEMRRQLALVALQPGVAQEWPVKRVQLS